MNTIMTFLSQGGFSSYLIVFAGLCLLVLGFERIYFLYFTQKSLSPESSSIFDQSIVSKDYSKALQICNSIKNNPELQVIKAGLVSLDSGREAMKSSLAGEIVEVTKVCETRMPIISLIASVATLLGLLGTISGLITTFSAIAKADASLKAELLGRGISEAMTATAAGLMVGISALVVYTICITRIDEIVAKSKKAGLRLIALVEQSERS